MKRKIYLLQVSLWSALFIFSFTACSDYNNQESVEVDMELAKLDTIKINLNSNDKMQFDKKEIVVFEGQVVLLKLNHIGTMPKSSMGHNFVLIHPSISISNYAKQALKEARNDYVVNNPDFTLVHTRMIGGGEYDEITFNAPPVGKYDFICSFPGHSSNMRGKFIVK